MLDLNSQHIDQIRNYFIATSDEEKISLQNSIEPMFLKGFLNDLKRLFILEPDNEIKLISIAKSMGASKHIEALKEIQEQFYSQLAEIYLKGETNQDIDELLQVQNKIFLDEVSFQEELQRSFIANERELFKKKFNEIDEVNNISQSDMEEAFNQIERARLKKKFKELDASFREDIVSEDYMVAEPSNVYGGKETDIKASIKVIKFNWTRFAIAASIIGFLTLAGYLFLQTGGKQENNQIAGNKEKENNLFGKENNLMEESKIYEVKEQRSFGTTTPSKADSVKVIFRDVVAMADLVDFKKTFLTNGFDSLANKGDAAINKNYILDSLNSLQKYLLLISKTYSYDSAKKIIILNVPATDSLMVIHLRSTDLRHQGIYVKLNNSFYRIDNGIERPLKHIQDRNLIKILQSF